MYTKSNNKDRKQYFKIFLRYEDGVFIARAAWTWFSLLLPFPSTPQDALTQVRRRVTGKRVISDRRLLQHFPEVRQISPCKERYSPIPREACFWDKSSLRISRAIFWREMVSALPVCPVVTQM